uniref:uncharacterized protein LOC120336906 n=1 Tax=Styela clava TaxID=7725 RepID=UPI00193AD0AE|nr:uncharacterized protein LOC120336906 [Styela clava]
MTTELPNALFPSTSDYAQRKKFNRQFVTVGMMQFIIGIGCVVIGGILTAISSAYLVTCTTVAGGLTFIVAGCSAFATGYPFNNVIMIFSIVVTSLSATFSAILTILGGLRLANTIDYGYYDQDDFNVWASRILCGVSGIEFITSLVHLVLCSQELCCSTNQIPPSGPTLMALHAPMVAAPPPYEQSSVPYKQFTDDPVE